MKKALSIIILSVSLLTACGTTPPPTVTEVPQAVEISTATLNSPSTSNSERVATIAVLETVTPSLAPSRPFTETPSPLATGTPIFDTDGNIIWHPQKVLISWGNFGGDGVSSSHHTQSLALFWDGTLIQSGNSNSSPPYIAKLNQNEVCKILNTVDSSGFFEERQGYIFPFDGLGSSNISIATWKTNSAGSQILDYAISGAPYDDLLFCRDCPIPSENTIIRPSLANVYYFLKNYTPGNRDKAPIEKLLIRIYPSEEKSIKTWPLITLPFDKFREMCSVLDCYDSGMIIEGDTALEIMEKMPSGQIFLGEFFGGHPSIRVTYSVVWPEAPDVPPGYTLTCNSKTGKYPLLSLNTQNKFWYYAPSGQWGAEVVNGGNNIRVINKFGYEKLYHYDPAFFGHISLQIYPRYWSKDDQFFYVNILPGDYKSNVSFANSVGLQQINVASGKIRYFFIGKEGQTFSYQLSREAKKVAYIRQEDQILRLVIVDTYSGEQQSISLTNPKGIPYSQAGSPVWSPNDDKIFLAAIYEENRVQKTHILVTHMDNLTDIHIVYKYDKPMKLRLNGNMDDDAEICSFISDAESYCSTSLYLITEEVKDW